MRKYGIRAASAVRLAYGEELVMGLEQREETRSVAEAMRAVQDALALRASEREAADKALARARVALRFADYELDQAIRTLRRHAEVADGGRVGALSQAVFPDGVVAETVPTGARQLRRARALVARVQELGSKGAEALRAQGGLAIADAVEGFAKAQASYEAASEAVSTAFAREQRARDEHRTQVERVIGHMRAIYPGDPALCDVFFPEVRTASARDEADATVEA